jgi:Na+:H+ antiporter, NhaA family
MAIRKYILDPFAELSETGKLSGILLICATVLSISLSNSEHGQAWVQLWQQKIGFSFLCKTLEHWVNDGLMVVFFFLVGLEIKRELLVGELADRRQAILPILAALGGIITPALIYFLFNMGPSGQLEGWAIPTATDIAFSLAILSLLGKRVPVSIKIFLTALAIIDDLGAILIIAVFYTGAIQWEMLLYSALILGVLILFSRLRLKRVGIYLLTGLFLWFFVLKSGIHPTIAGVLLALLIPRELTGTMEHFLHKPVNYIILPLFALANTAIPLSLESAASAFSGISLGIVVGLFLGKPIGILLFSYAGVRSGWARLPQKTTWKMMTGVGLIAGIGFTMSIFIASLSFDDPATLNIAKLAIIAGSVLSAMAGYFVFYLKGR